MKSMTLFYDDKNPLALRFRWWMATQPAYVELGFHPLTSLDGQRRLSALSQPPTPGEEIVLLSDEGAVYRGPEAWAMALYSLKTTREEALRFSNPANLYLAREKAKSLVSSPEQPRRGTNFSRLGLACLLCSSIPGLITRFMLDGKVSSASVFSFLLVPVVLVPAGILLSLIGLARSVTRRDALGVLEAIAGPVLLTLTAMFS